MEQLKLPFPKSNDSIQYNSKKQKFIVQTCIAQNSNIESCKSCIMHFDVPSGEAKEMRGYCMFLQQELTFTNIYVSIPKICPLKQQAQNEIQIDNISTNDELPVFVIKPTISNDVRKTLNTDTKNNNGQDNNLQCCSFTDGFYTISNSVVDEINARLICSNK